jgi:hypothetical protein
MGWIAPSLPGDLREEERIDGHGGIWQTPFLLFIATLLFQHVQASQKGPAEAGAALGDLAAFARSIAPIKVPTTVSKEPG